MQARTFTLLAAALIAAAPAMAATPAYRVTGSIAGPDGGWDYASVDPATRRLYVAHGNAIMAVDLASGVATPALSPAAHAHAVLPIPGSGLLLETEGDTATVRLLNAATGAETARIPVGKKPDAAIWDPVRKRAVVMNADSGTIMLVDPATAKVTATITAAPGLEFAALDASGLLYVNNEDRDQIAVVDPDKARLLGWIALPGCKGPTGMAYAPTARVIVSACGNGIAAIVDPKTRRMIGTAAIGMGADAVIPDPARKRLFVPAGQSGTLTVLDEAPGQVRAVETVTTDVSARTGTVDPTDGKVYLPAAKMAAADTPGGRPRPVPGSFHLIVVSPQ
ncbi:YncE family protein [Sphingomonas sp. AP4-R1]|uniref:YVTN family beta-propeller repeat protein n=1 Tax=Sphingomonas sp. AP4-R1 TaxID=2735134 RepID=UPI0014938BF7|nr:YncE family protein [Sphingomonas sp. AP4-R1]QJU59083.1 YncE family protein [Sphingomonas sp. AP4-R1]